MSSMFTESLPRSSRAVYERQIWGQFFGALIRSARETRGLSIEEASRAVGMAVSEWEAIEAGTVPRTREQLEAVAAGLDIEWDAMASLVLVCGQAWGR